MIKKRVNGSLIPQELKPYYLNELHPEGWYLDQLRIQADGLSGSLDLFWNDIQNSAWIGGSAEGWERLPYYLDGLIPLASLLGDEALISRARGYINAILSRQGEDGWICPEPSEGRENYDIWSYFLILKVLVEWHDATRDDKIEQAMYNALRCLDKTIDKTPIFEWAKMRWFECLIPIFWLYERRPEAWLIDLAEKLRMQGFDWIDFFKEWPLMDKVERGAWDQKSHVVNNAMMLKLPALLAQLTDEEDVYSAAERMVGLLDRFHGMVTGVFTGDECLAGTSPVQGTELCAVVEYLYSLRYLMRHKGDTVWADRLELIAFNALPATFSPDMWLHQYDQQVNQMSCTVQDPPIFLTNSPDSNIFGLEPNYGCCTSNMHQGWPKLISSAILRAEEGPVIAIWIPFTLRTSMDGVDVEVKVVTGYPFRQSAKVHVTTSDKVDFVLKMRVPGWCGESEAVLGDRKYKCDAGNYLEISNTWMGSNTIDVTLPCEAALESRPNGLYAVRRGPLIYSLRIGEEWVQMEGRSWGCNNEKHDYELRPTTTWNYALCADPDAPGKTLFFEDAPITGVPFSPEGSPVICRAKGRKVRWDIEYGCAKAVPDGVLEGDAEQIELIPYGCTNLRMTEMPLCNEFDVNP